jgi:hypothetical protein
MKERDRERERAARASKPAITVIDAVAEKAK